MLVLCFAFALSACAPTTYQTPAGKAAYSAVQVEIRLGEFQNAVIDAEGVNKINTADARAIVTWISGDVTTEPPTLGAVDILGASPGGWKETVRASWLVVRPKVLKSPALVTWATVIDMLLEGVF